MKVHNAVAAVFVCKEKFYITKRQDFLKAFPGFYAFPGGKIEEVDQQDQEKNNFDIDTTQYNALRREMLEELGFDLSDQKVQSISYLCLLKSPNFNPVIYHTHFYLIEVSEELNFTEDRQEILFGKWVTHQDFNAEYQSGKVLIVPPVYNLIKYLDKSSKSGKLESYPDIGHDKLPTVQMLYGVRIIFTPF